VIVPSHHLDAVPAAALGHAPPAGGPGLATGREQDFANGPGPAGR